MAMVHGPSPSAFSHQPLTASETQAAQDVLAALYHLFTIDPDVAGAGEDIDVRARFPRGAGLAAVGIAEGEVDAGHLLVLQQHADHVAQRQVGAEGELADAVAVLVGVAVLPEFLLEIFSYALRGI